MHRYQACEQVSVLPFSRLLGRISFLLYLVHGPILVLIGEPLVRNFGETAQSKLTIGICMIAALPMISVNKLAIQISRFFGHQTVYGYNRVRTQVAPSQN